MVSSYKLSQESQLPTMYQHEISDHWQTGEFSTFNSFDGLTIAYALFYSEKNQQGIVISPGRSEGYLKYKEVAFDLFNQGYNVAIIDHRGQGLSERMLNDPHKGFVDDFNDYVLDLEFFSQKIVKPKFKNNLYLMAHSMGGAIATLYLQKYPNTFKAAVLLSPMIAVNGGSIPDWIAKLVINISYSVDSLLFKQSNYFYGYGPYQEKGFAGNDLTLSKVRYDIFKNEYQRNPKLQLGGITFAWLKQAIKTQTLLFDNINKITTPVLLLQAERDIVVKNDTQAKFCKQLHNVHSQSCPDGKPLIINNALHELLFEIDEVRNEALSSTLDWFSLH